jgi:hypothetical protein
MANGFNAETAEERAENAEREMDGALVKEPIIS